jgi:hypothetical protein
MSIPEAVNVRLWCKRSLASVMERTEMRPEEKGAAQGDSPSARAPMFVEAPCVRNSTTSVMSGHPGPSKSLPDQILRFEVVMR